jgi:hypothetical protein
MTSIASRKLRRSWSTVILLQTITLVEVEAKWCVPEFNRCLSCFGVVDANGGREISF